MSKKKFTDGWEGLFESSSDSAAGAMLLFELPEPSPPKKLRKPKATLVDALPKHAGKSFASDLASFLEEAFEESFVEQTQQRTDATPSAEANAPKRPAPRGLDALIRSTLPQEGEPDSAGAAGQSVRRLVLFLDEAKVNKLKSIAREERKQLRAIVDQIVAAFIAEYEKR